jgi:hypothetical protein
MRLSNYFFTTDGAAQSTIALATVRLSSNSTDSGKENSIDYLSPAFPLFEFQGIFYNPTTNAFTVHVKSREIGLSTGSTEDYCYNDSFTIYGSTDLTAGKRSVFLYGVFNGAGARFSFFNNSSGSSDSTSSVITMAIKGLRRE